MAEQQASPVTTLRGTITLLFTDVEGSTKLLQRFGDASVRMLEDHKAILRETMAEFGGREVDTAGDGFFLVFDVARDAVAAAVETQRRLCGHHWPEGEPVRVRMGMHTGEPILAGQKYLGLDVHRAARICAAGHGGQILISATTRQLVINELPAGVGLRDLGEHRLKDLQHPETVFQVVAPGLPHEFPPLRSFGRHRSNLPAQANRLIGRDMEVDIVRRLLLDEHVRLVTLTGPGGTGKTRLALQAAGGLVNAFEEGVLLVTLASTTEAELVPSAIAQTLGVTPAADQPPLAGVIEHLRARELLLVLDNFEQVVGAADDVAELLAACPKLKVLATSRVALNLTVEREFPVPPLSVPDPRRERTSERLLRFPAVELFTQRAEAVSPSFKLDDEGALAVAEICYRLDGLPLAIELAAARVKVFSPRALLARLDNRLALLSGGARDMPARHRTLRQAIGWSYDLLDASEQALFRRLAAFRGGCALEALEAVCEAAGPLELALIDGVSALVDKSLLRQEAGADDEPRFTMLETIREFALETLVGSGEEAATRDAHADFFTALAERAEPELTGPMQITWLERLAQEHDNFRAAFAWAERSRDARRGLRLAGAFWRFWVVRGPLSEGRDRLEAMLAIPAPEVPPEVRLKALAGAATIAHEQGHLGAARRWLEESQEIARAAGDRHMLGRTLTNLSWVEFHAGDHERGRELAREGLAIHRELNDTRGIALALTNLGWIANYECEYAEGVRLHEESHALRRSLGDARGIAYAQVNMAWPLEKLGEFERAERLLLEAIDILRGLGDQQILSFALAILGEIRYAQLRLDEAIPLVQEALALAREIAHAFDTAFAHLLLGLTHDARGERDLAVQHFEQCRPMASIDAQWPGAQASRAVGELERICGRPAEALAAYGRALEQFRPLRARCEIAECLLGIAQVESTRGEHTRAACALAALESLRSEVNAPLPPVRRRVYEAVAGAARAALGTEEFERVRAECGALPWTDAMERARSAR